MMSTIITMAAYLMNVAATIQPPPLLGDGSLVSSSNSSNSLLLRPILVLLGLLTATTLLLSELVNARSMCEARAVSRETLSRETLLCRLRAPHPALSEPRPRLLFRSAPRYPRGCHEPSGASP